MPAPPHRRTSLTGVLGGPFGLLWAGQTVSMLGDGVFLVAFTWQLAVRWQQPALLGLLLAARVLAELATLALGGWSIDRLPRRSTVLGADAGRAPLLLGMAPALHQPPPVPALALLVIAYGVLTALFRPALVAYLPELVQSDRLASANSLLAVSMQTSMVAGLRGRPAARPCHAHLRAGPRHPGRGHGWPCVRLRPAARRTAMDHRVATQHPGCLAASAPSTTSARSCSCRPSFAFGALLVESAGAELVLLTAGAIGILVAAIGLAVPGLHRWRRFGSDDDVIQPAAGSRHGAPQP